MKIIAITGGPCAGKTSVMDVLRAHLERAGVSAVFVPEAATDLITSGVAPWTCASTLDFQARVIALQLKREAAARAQAVATGAAAVICDRGICDSHAYLHDDEFRTALTANGITQEQAFARYDAVFHLESVAKDDPGAYTQANNSARFENAEEAAAVNERVIEAWSSHPAFRIIGNHPSFDEKAQELCEELARLVATDKTV